MYRVNIINKIFQKLNDRIQVINQALLQGFNNKNPIKNYQIDFKYIVIEFRQKTNHKQSKNLYLVT